MKSRSVTHFLVAQASLLAVVPLLCAGLLTPHAAFAQVPGIINYQGRIVDNGTNFTGTGQFQFALLGATNTAISATATAVVNSGFITSYVVVIGGSGYTSSPTVTITDSTGSGALAHANVSGGGVTSVVVSNSMVGSNYSLTPIVTIAPPPPNIVAATAWSNGINTVSLPVTKGLYSVLLGDTTLANMSSSIPATVFTNADVLLRVWFNDGVNGLEQLSPDQRLGAVGYAMNATMAQTAVNIVPTSIVQGQQLNIGLGNILSGTLATIAGGSNNTAGASYATVGGGYGNTASGTYASTVGGGWGNTASNDYSTVAGGIGNTAGVGGLSANATVGGGAGNNANANSATVSGGLQNSASGAGATVGGGYNNTASGQNATVAGGGSPLGAYGNTASGNYSTVAGGIGNTAVGTQSAVGGGYLNIASNLNATVPGGFDNLASGTNSFAAGTSAIASNTGAFVWADDSTATPFASTANNQVSFRCLGGVLFTDGLGGLNNTVSWTPGSGAWAFTSDRNAKENFAPLDVRAVLVRVAQLPLMEWSYKGYVDRHIGPMAQDFHAAFPFNPDDKMLNSADVAGVSLAAIQGLYQELQEEKARNAKLEKRLEELEQKVGE